MNIICVCFVHSDTFDIVHLFVPEHILYVQRPVDQDVVIISMLNRMLACIKTSHCFVTRFHDLRNDCTQHSQSGVQHRGQVPAHTPKGARIDVWNMCNHWILVDDYVCRCFVRLLVWTPHTLDQSLTAAQFSFKRIDWVGSRGYSTEKIRDRPTLMLLFLAHFLLSQNAVFSTWQFCSDGCWPSGIYSLAGRRKSTL